LGPRQRLALEIGETDHREIRENKEVNHREIRKVRETRGTSN